jgi:hydrogenase maturation protease
LAGIDFGSIIRIPCIRAMRLPPSCLLYWTIGFSGSIAHPWIYLTDIPVNIHIMSMKTLVIGAGNLLRADDGVGLRVIDALRREDLEEGVDLNDDSAGLDIVTAIAGYDRVILVDAIKSGGEPGTIYRLSLEDFEKRQTVHSFSTHVNMDFPAMLELGKKLFPGKMPADIVIIGIEARELMTISDRCTPEVEEAIPRAVELIRSLLS